MRALTLAILMTLVAPSHAAVTVIKDATGRSVTAHSRQLLVHAGGRVAVSPLAPLSPKSALAYFHQWPAVYWEAAFAGDQLMLKFDDEKNEYRLTIDDAAVVPIPQPGAAVIVVRGLGPGRHRVRLDKVTESVEFVRAFDGFFVSPGESALPAPLPRSRQIEFVGDSGMTGYGVRSASRTCTKEEVRLRTDSSSAWPSLVAHTIDADYQINAISGRGLVRNYGGVEPARVMSALYPRILPDRPAVWQDRSWHPEVMVIVLFSDFATTLQPGERWPDQVALAADYVKAYQQFVTSLHQRAPRATLVLPWPDSAKSADVAMRQLSASAQTAIRAAAIHAGVARIEFPPLPEFTSQNSACDFHGSLSDHQHMAEWMTAWLNARPEIWATSRAGRPPLGG